MPVGTLDRKVGQVMNIRGWRALHCFIAASVLVTAWSPAHATVVIESYMFERPRDASDILAPVYAGLHERGIYARPEAVLGEIRGALPLPVNDSFDVNPGDVMQRIDLGMSKARYGKNEEAIHLFQNALVDLRNNPAMAVSMADGRSWITKALAGLARAHLESGNLKEAAEVITEYIRTFPGVPIDRGRYGPKLASFYTKTRSALDAEPRGKLLLVTDRIDGKFFINEYARGEGNVFGMTCPPGEYRILIQVGAVARRYRVRIDPPADTVLRIKWDTDTAFVVSREWLGFIWPEWRPEALSEFVNRIVKQNVSHGVIVLGIVPRGRHRYITARHYSSVTGQYLDGASIELGSREDTKIRALVRFLAAGEHSSELLPLVHEPAPLILAPSKPARWPVWASATTAASAFAVGGYLLAIDGSCRDPECGETRDTKMWGWGAVGVGAAAAAFGAYWYLRSRPKSGATARVIGFQPRPSGGLLTLSRQF